MTKSESGKPAGETVAITPFQNLTDKALHGIRQIYDSMPSTRAALEVLFAVDAAQTNPTDAWIGFFVETACAQMIWDERPTGTIRGEDADWVLGRFDEAPTLSTLALLVRLVEEAQRIPPTFAAEVRRRAEFFSTLMPGAVKKERKPVSYLRLVA